jgi:hypothetical protein
MKQVLLSKEEVQIVIGLLLNVPFAQVGSVALKNAAALITRLEQAEEVKPELTEVKKKA